jgi:leader peptidase (prepilin peptidase)/N-methyltransferase
MLIVWLVVVFLIGAAIGSFLNVCIFRLPYEKSLFWPGSRCGQCYQPIRLVDNIPLLSYWLLRGRCRLCGARFSPRYFLVELVTGLAFVGLFYLIVQVNVLNLEVVKNNAFAIQWGYVPWQAVVVCIVHATLLCFLLVASFIDLEHFEIPLPVTITGTVVGLVIATLLPWPWPNPVTKASPAPPGMLPPFLGAPPRMGTLLWPVWDPLPAWLPAGSWRCGLFTALAGMLAGMLLLRGIRFVFGLGRGKEGLGIGDADLMMMAGCFLGWQAIVVAFFLSVFPALVIGVGHIILRGKQEIPFGPSLAAGILTTLFCWQWIGPAVHWFFFNGTMVAVMAGGGAFFLLVLSFLLRLLRH